jgi:hypothetical protein
MVEIMGDFTGWLPIVMHDRADGSWEARLPLAPGLHQLNVRVDRGAWGPPPGLMTTSDGFNGTVGVLIIE